MSPSTRKEARLAGENKYFTGKPCLRGHVAHRYTKDSTCCQCVSEKQKQYRTEQSERFWKVRRKWISENIELVRKRKAEWKKRNPAKVVLDTVNRNAAKLQRTPAWLTPVDLLEIESIYEYCSALRKCGLDYHVDHIVPLRGTIVSGLHVPLNLQVIPASENNRKRNKYGE